MNSERPSIDQQITFLYTEDGPTSWAFYEDVLGVKLAMDRGGCRIYQIARCAYVGVCQRADVRPTEGVMVSIVADDVDAWADRLKVHGVEFTTEPNHNSEYGIYQFVIKDPNGYQIEVMKFDQELGSLE
ncbi:MAG: VOC family protein [Planctomycetota bacterium]|jgi:predicted enzyme related to lactoylglutathione lyase